MRKWTSANKSPRKSELSNALRLAQESDTQVNRDTAQVCRYQGNTDAKELNTADYLAQCPECMSYPPEGKSFCNCGKHLSWGTKWGQQVKYKIWVDIITIIILDIDKWVLGALRGPHIGKTQVSKEHGDAKGHFKMATKRKDESDNAHGTKHMQFDGMKTVFAGTA